MYIDPETGLEYPAAKAAADDALNHYRPTTGELEVALAPMILSASGWRKVFAPDGEESAAPNLANADQVLAAVMGLSFFRFIAQETGSARPRICVGLDSRPTGPLLADRMLRVLVQLGAECEYLGIVAAPEIMGYVGTSGRHDGFVYVSASHNPIGHNGVKFGLSDGGVVGGALSARLIAAYRADLADPDTVAQVLEHVKRAPASALQALLDGMVAGRNASSISYTRLSDTILTLSDDPVTQARRKADLKALVDQAGLGIVAEFNGSARGVSIDRSWLSDLGITVATLNDKPRQIVHRIVPEGASLDLCRDTLAARAAQNPTFALGYVPDCDGDRGNVVWYDARERAAKILEAQEVFSLCVLSELAGLKYYGEAGEKVAVVCNDPTSLRIDAIARGFGAQVFRAEVGEANVVGLARRLRQEGWTVRILGEGSNGGNITHPGSVRDPLSTLGSLIKLLQLRSVPGTPGLFELWCQASGQSSAFRNDANLADILATVPAWTTTSAYEDRAVLKVSSTDHVTLKAAIEREFLADWPRRKGELRAVLGVTTWTEVNFEGQAEKPGFGPEFRTGKHTGGLKFELRKADGAVVACLWMRGSGTEPVFRILVDVEGYSPDAEALLLDWLTDLVRRADKK